MMFEDIKFTEGRLRARARGPGLMLPGGYWVPKTDVETAWRLVTTAFPKLTWEKPHTAKTMCQDPLWADRPKGQRIAFGRCIRFFVTRGMLRLTEANHGSSGSRKYRPE